MNIADIKKEMLEWLDFYGQDFVECDKIEKAKTKKELKEVIEGHLFFLETQNIDAITHIEQFKKKIGLG